MTPDEAQRLAELLRRRREALGLSASEVARRSGVNKGTVTRIELGQIASPRPDSLTAIGDVLGIPASDLFAIADWLPKRQLPTFLPYMRAKYKELPATAVAEMEAYFDRLARKHGVQGPVDGEDEH